jgi:hypothetical protein
MMCCHQTVNAKKINGKSIKIVSNFRVGASMLSIKIF